MCSYARSVLWNCFLGQLSGLISLAEPSDILGTCAPAEICHGMLIVHSVPACKAFSMPLTLYQCHPVDDRCLSCCPG